MGLIQRIKEKAGRVAPAVMGVGLIAGIGLSLATGGAMATDENTTAAVAKYYGLSMLQWIMAVLVLIFGGATIWLRDFRTALLALIGIVGMVFAGFLGL